MFTTRARASGLLTLGAAVLALMSCDRTHASPDGADARARSVGIAASLASTVPDVQPAPLDRDAASRFAALSLSCVDKEYPNKPDHIVESEAMLEPARIH